MNQGLLDGQTVGRIAEDVDHHAVAIEQRVGASTRPRVHRGARPGRPAARRSRIAPALRWRRDTPGSVRR